MCVYIKGQSGFILCLHSLFISHFETDIVSIFFLDVCMSMQVLMNCNVLNAMKVDAVNSAVCGFCGNTVCRLQ